MKRVNHIMKLKTELRFLLNYFTKCDISIGCYIPGICKARMEGEIVKKYSFDRKGFLLNRPESILGLPKYTICSPWSIHTASLAAIARQIVLMVRDVLGACSDFTKAVKIKKSCRSSKMYTALY